MGREIRRTPVGWEPPVVPPRYTSWGRNDRDWTGQGRWFQSQYDTSLAEAQEKWDAEKAQWDVGTHPDMLSMLVEHSPGPYYYDRQEKVSRRGTLTDDQLGEEWEGHPGRKRYHVGVGEKDTIWGDDRNTILKTVWYRSIADIQVHCPFEQDHGKRPGEIDYDGPEMYHPDWRNLGEELGYQFYETVTEGTPLSPSFATLRELEDWFVSQGHSREAARAFCDQGWVPTFTGVSTPTGNQLVGDIEQSLL